MRVKAFLFAAALAAMLAASSSSPTALGGPGVTPIPCPDQEWQPGDPAFEALPGAKVSFGKYDGGRYRIEVPANWNGELVLFAHGFVPNTGANGSNLRVGTHRIREHLIQQGFAWAASSYRCNGYVPGQGLLDTVALTDLFTTSNDGRAPQRTYLTGESMGGHITLLGMQEFPTMFAGGLAMCPAGPELFDYYAAVSAAAEVVTGVQFHADTMQQDIAKMSDLLGKPPEYTEKGRQLASVEIQISGGPRPFAMEGLASRFVANMATSQGALLGSTTPSNRAIDTAHIRYSIDPGLGLTAEALNAQARRKTGDPAIRSATGPYEEIVPFDGKIQRPLLTMHGTGDLYVPIFLEQALKRAVVAAGNERLLTQRIYRIGAHCQFSQAEMIKAFDDLVTWVRQGTKPEGDETYGDLSNAGLKFTTPLRANDPGGLTIASKPSTPSQGAIARVDFGRDVQPIFKQHCIGCHGPTVHQSGFRLDQRSAAMRGGTTSPGVIRPGDSGSSFLYFRVSSGQFGPQMPPTGALSPQQIDTIKAWLDQGAEWPDQFAGETPPPPVHPAASKIMDALRRGDRQAFTTLAAATENAGNLRGPEGSTPLMYAVLYGTAQDVKRLLDGGADPNIKNNVGATALMWAAGDVDKTRLLLEHRADVNARSDDGRTPLHIAAGRIGALPVVKLLLDRGANVSTKGTSLFGDTTPIAEAAGIGDEAVMRLLIERGADVNATPFVTLAGALRSPCSACADLVLAAFPQPMLNPTMLFSGPPLGIDATMKTVTRLLDRGADVNAKDQQGRTILMLIAASDTLPIDVIRTLIARGADVHAKSANGDTALSFAKQRGQTAVVDLLLTAGAVDVPVSPAPTPRTVPAASPRAAVERSLPLLQKTDAVFLKKSGCVSCHNNTLTSMTVAAARKSGMRVDDEAARVQVKTIATFIDTWRERALQGVGIPGDADTVSYIMLGLAAEGHPADPATDAMARFLKGQQHADGHWQILGHRPPIESSDVEVTAASMRALQLYAPRAQRAEYDKAVAAASAWLQKATAATTEDRAFQLLGLAWARVDKAAIDKVARGLVAEQRPDGGWSQLRSLGSDAYATGEALYALKESGAGSVSDAAFKKGVQFLLNTQLEDGSWYVPTRALAIQPLFDIGFPHGRDSWISAAGTNWAAMALARMDLTVGPRYRSRAPVPR